MQRIAAKVKAGNGSNQWPMVRLGDVRCHASSMFKSIQRRHISSPVCIVSVEAYF
jgi:hypothetical protein